MKKCVVLGLAFAMALSACGGSGDGAASTGAATGTGASAMAAADSADMRGALSPVARNILGLLKLEDTELAVDPTQAKTLLPLWQAYRSLLNSDTTAPAELEALQAQIDQALTDEQQDAIAAMDLSPQDMFTMAEELGVTSFEALGDRGDSSGTRPSFNGGGPGGAGGGMAPPDGGGGPQGPSVFIQGAEGGSLRDSGGALDPQALATLQASRPAGGQSDRFSLALLDPLIDLLKERARG